MKVLRGYGKYITNRLKTINEGHFDIPMDSISHIVEGEDVTTYISLKNGDTLIVSLNEINHLSIVEVKSTEDLLKNHIKHAKEVLRG
jgi:hypothetical protein